MKFFSLAGFYVLVLQLMLSLGACAVMEAEFVGPKTWLVSGMERIQRGEWERLDEKVKTDFYAAKNEFEPLQIVIRAPRSGLQNVVVSVSEFQHENGFRLPAPSLYREHYVQIRGSRTGSPLDKNPSGGSGWYADALIPFEGQAANAQLLASPFKLAARQNQPIWVDVFVPANAPAGLYTSRYTVNSIEGSSTGEIRLEVWDFALPKTPTLKSSFQLWQEKTEAARVELIKHKIMPLSTPAEEQSRLINELGLNSSDTSFWGGANYETCRLENPPSVETLRAKRQSFDDRLLVYNYTADEIDRCEGLVPKLKDWARNLHAADIRQLVVMMPISQLLDDGTGRPAVDIFVVSPRMYETFENSAKRIAEAQAKGSEVWSYSALVHLDDTPKWAIDFAPMNFRIIPGFLNQTYGLTGLLYWRADLWSNAPWSDVNPPDPFYPAGEGMFVYPGQQAGIQGVAPSMRLKWLREGVEDYEYVHLLKTLGQESQALSIINPVAKSWRNWSREPAAIEEVRKQLAEAILRYQ